MQSLISFSHTIVNGNIAGKYLFAVINQNFTTKRVIEAIPPWLRMYTHTIRAEPCEDIDAVIPTPGNLTRLELLWHRDGPLILNGRTEMSYILPNVNDGVLEFQLTLQPHCWLYTVDFDRSLFKYKEYPPDANKAIPLG